MIDRNELNRENLHFWADLQCLEAESKSESITTQKVLADLCLSDYKNTIIGCDSDSWFDELMSLAMDGTKGFNDYTVEECLDHLMDQVRHYRSKTVTDFIKALRENDNDDEDEEDDDDDD